MTPALEGCTNDAFRYFTTVAIAGVGLKPSLSDRVLASVANAFLCGFFVQAAFIHSGDLHPGRLTQAYTLIQIAVDAPMSLTFDWDLAGMNQKNCKVIANRVGQAAITMAMMPLQQMALPRLGQQEDPLLELGSVSAEMLQGVAITSVVHLSAKGLHRSGIPRLLTFAALMPLFFILTNSFFSSPTPGNINMCAYFIYLIRSSCIISVLEANNNP